MNFLNPLHLILAGFALLVIGFALPFGMIMQVIPSTFFLNFVSYITSFLGVMLGIIASLSYVTRHRGK